jgi:hypothetical protein
LIENGLLEFDEEQFGIRLRDDVKDRIAFYLILPNSGQMYTKIEAVDVAVRRKVYDYWGP